MAPQVYLDELLNLLQRIDASQSVTAFSCLPTDAKQRLAWSLAVYPCDNWESIARSIADHVGSAWAGAELYDNLGIRLFAQARVEFHVQQPLAMDAHSKASCATQASRYAFEIAAFLDSGRKALTDYHLRELNGYLATATAFFRPRCDSTEVRDGFVLLQARKTDKQVVLLSDRSEHLDAIGEGILCDGRNIEEAFQGFDLKHCVFFYACEMDHIGERYIAHVIANGGEFVSVSSTERRAKYWHVTPTVWEVLREEFFRQSAEGICKWDEADFLNIVQWIDLTAHLPGDYVEVGTYYGSSAAVAISYMRNSGMQRRGFYFDVFDGFNYPEAHASADQMWVGSHATPGREFVERHLQSRSADPSTVHVVKANIISEPLPDTIQQIAIANLDVDMYEAVAAGLGKLGPRIVPGGVIIVEDCGHTPALIGARVALTQFLATPLGEEFLPIYMESGQTVLLKRDR
jgi:hypothetical protein